jgi:hypothetical protein
MLKVIYIPDCEEVLLHSYPTDRASLERLFEEDTTIFFRDYSYEHSGNPDLKANFNRIKPMWNAESYVSPIPKYYFEIVEVKDV